MVGVYSPPFGFEKDKREINKIIEVIKEARPQILIVGLGCPKQGKFIFKYYKELNVPISFAVGVSLDFEAGNIRRTPRWMCNNGLEWLYRLIQEPKRMFRRYIINDMKIFRLVLKYRNGLIG